MAYELLLTTASEQLSKARLLKGSAVGVAIKLKDGTVTTGFNIENRVQKGYHAEEVAIISALKLGAKNNDFEAIAIVYGGSSDHIYPCCACCRQMLWEYTNPELIVVAYNMETKSGATYRLIDLYPMPYPMPKNEQSSMSQTCNEEKKKGEKEKKHVKTN